MMPALAVHPAMMQRGRAPPVPSKLRKKDPLYSVDELGFYIRCEESPSDEDSQWWEVQHRDKRYSTPVVGSRGIDGSIMYDGQQMPTIQNHPSWPRNGLAMQSASGPIISLSNSPNKLNPYGMHTSAPALPTAPPGRLLLPETPLPTPKRDDNTGRLFNGPPNRSVFEYGNSNSRVGLTPRMDGKLKRLAERLPHASNHKTGLRAAYVLAALKKQMAQEAALKRSESNNADSPHK